MHYRVLICSLGHSIVMLVLAPTHCEQVTCLHDEHRVRRDGEEGVVLRVLRRRRQSRRRHGEGRAGRIGGRRRGAAGAAAARRGRGGGGAAVVLDDDAPGEAAAEAVRVGGEAGPQFVLLFAKYVCKASVWGFNE